MSERGAQMSKMAADGVEQHDVEPVNNPQFRELYKKRVQIYPKLVYGTFRTWKWIVMIVTLGIYYGLPWVRWDRGPAAPDQAVLVDFENRRFYFFFIEIWPQEIYYLTGLLIFAALALFLVTALFGRVWCGYTCPQTVWTDLFIAVERLFEGDRNARIRLDKERLSLNKAWRKTGKHTVWLLIAMATGGAWIFYFHDAPTLLQELPQGTAPFTAYLFLGLMTFTTYTLGGTMREQVCTFMCPWPRIQAALIDTESLAVTYRVDRGEPRGPHKRGASWEGRGDCIDCNQCVAACPMGIDIRDGLQLECIQCALCIDACDDIMDKVDRPRGLIAYDTDQNIERRLAGDPARFRLIRLRTTLYAILLVAVGSIMLYGLATRDFLDVNILRDRTPQYVLNSDGSVRNGFTLKILNMQPDARRYRVTVDGVGGAVFTVVGYGERFTDLPEIEAPADKTSSVRIYITIPPDALPDEKITPIVFRVEDVDAGTVETAETVFVRN